jgi:hypothetical protein
MLARFDHRPMLTALLTLSTAVLVVVVMTLATLLITSSQAATPSSVSDGGYAGEAAPANPLPHRPNMDLGGESYGSSNTTRGESYRWNLQSQDQRP